MHVLLVSILVIFAIWKGDWRNIEKYSLTIFYVITCNLLYNVFCHNYLLWRYIPDLLPKSHILTELLYSFIVLPSITLLYLTHFPFEKKVNKQLLYIFEWVIGSLLILYPFLLLGRLVLQHGYRYWMDFFFYMAMYCMIRLHYTRPLATYGISIIIIIFLLNYFHVPIK